ncbi:MAG: Rieske 2Fe-2S domain-containing protein [Oscillospiraceae bacterium]
MDIRCPHRGCELTWNDDEKSWDCPCHGSRFDYTGRRLSEPAKAALKPCKDFPQEI